MMRIKSAKISYNSIKPKENTEGSLTVWIMQVLAIPYERIFIYSFPW